MSIGSATIRTAGLVLAAILCSGVAGGFEPIESSVLQGARYDNATEVPAQTRDGQILSFRDADAQDTYVSGYVAKDDPSIRGDLLMAQNRSDSSSLANDLTPEPQEALDLESAPDGGGTSHEAVWGGEDGLYKWGVGTYIEYLILDDEVAKREGIGDDGYGFGVYTEYRPFAYLGLTLGLAGTVLDDEEQFRQVVVEERVFDDDKVVLESSEVEGYSAFAEATGYLPLGIRNTFHLGLGVGYKHVDVQREIPFCDDCREEDVDVDGGGYLSPQFSLNYPKWSCGLAYEWFFSGDIEGVVAGNLAFTLAW